jgi:hypothetical protein
MVCITTNPINNLKIKMTSCYSRNILLLLLLTVLSQNLYSQSCDGFIETCKQNQSWIYESRKNSDTQILYDRGKYRVSRTLKNQIFFKDKHKFENVFTTKIYYFDKSLPYIVWEFDPKTKIAKPTYFSCQYFLANTVKKLGLLKIREQYHIPNTPLNNKRLSGDFGRFRSDFYRTVDLYSYIQQPFPREFILKGQSYVAGQRCDIYEIRTSNQSFNLEYVEVKSQLILREESISNGGNPRIAPTKNINSATFFRFLKSIPSTEFQLPPGTTAIIPKIMKEIPLPLGITRKIMTGSDSEVGFDIKMAFQPLPKNMKDMEIGKSQKK